MKALVGVYESHDDAIHALNELEQSGYPVKELSVMAKADLVNNHIYVHPNDKVEKAEVSIGAIAGAVLGLLAGIGIFSIPGVGLLYGAGAFIGAFAGAEAGVITGGMAALLTKVLKVDETLAHRYEKHLNEGKFLVFANGNDEQIDHAKHVIHTQGLSLELEAG